MESNKPIISGIYKISNILDNRKYIGSAENINGRWQRHLSCIKRDKHHSAKLQNWCNKYSINYLIFEIIEVCTKDVLLIREQWYLDNVVDWKRDWNICRIAGNTSGRLCSKETKARISKAHKGKKCPQSTIDACSKAVAQYNLDGLFIRKWSSAAEVERELNICHSTLSKCCMGKSYTANKYMWRYYTTEDNIIPEQKVGKSQSRTRKIALIDDLGNILQTFNKISDAVKELTLHSASIINVCQGKQSNTKGYKFKYN